MEGANWNAADRAFASCSVSARWPSTWIGAATALQAAAYWLPCCAVSAALPDVAEEPALFCWLTEPPPPGLLTRTGEATIRRAELRDEGGREGCLPGLRFLAEDLDRGAGGVLHRALSS